MEAVIFDMDGVLIDSHSIAIRLLCEAANRYGCSLTSDEIRTWGSLSSRQFWNKVKDDFQLPHELNELIQSYDVDREIELYKELELIPGVRDLLNDLRQRGIKTALATSASSKRMNAVLDIFKIRDRFDHCVCDDEVKASKPNPQIFLLAASKLRVDPSVCVVIEDSRNGLLAAKAAGMKCIGFKGLAHVHENMAGADLIVTDFNDREFIHKVK
jgi:haloacid dehalogenase superfamily, subfamily IA, variant 3 with third motif having DD or ED/haloacid dehalogenase superfamily, subfamily IA, variant 1 with third motif having Dx(3-4)D or Dx(3-4)E